jgi:pyruvate dehydrogenase E2 component (dihydrolipoamide acetyltransferase)
MPTDVIMPQMGESILEGTITKWLKKAGDAVLKDEPLFEISTDKVDAEIPSPVAGVLQEIKVFEGETVQINTVVAVVAEEVTEKAAAAKASSKNQAPAHQKSPSPAQMAPQAQLAPPQLVVMPQMGESIFEGTITKWLKKAGDTVQKDEPLFEISTDKVDAEIPSPVTGVLTEVKIGEGETVEINTVVAVIATVAQAVAQPDGSPTTVPPPIPAAMPGMFEPATPAPQVRSAPPQVVQVAVRSSPLVRRMAREHKLDLRRIAGSGSSGRITKDDVLLYMKNGAAAATPLSPPVNRTTPAPPAPLAPPQVAQEVVGDRLEPMSRMRSIIAQRMVESRRTSPHAYSVYKVDMTSVVRLRERTKASFEQRHGVKLTYMPFIAAAAIEALRRFPIVNASLEGNALRYHEKIHLGVAVALEWGLIVPVIREAERLSFRDLAAAITDLAERARTKKLKPEEASGSTFTLTNSGVFGGEYGTPIINQPESAILAIGGLRKEPVVLTDAEGNDSIAIRSMQQYCLGFDHRAIDGADAGKFMTVFKDALEKWNSPIE